MERNNKQILFAVLGVLVLIVAVIGVSYAMFTFSAQGTKENKITTASISMSYAEATNIDLTTAYPVAGATCTADALTDTQNCGEMEFTVSADLSAATTINYGIYVKSAVIKMVDGSTAKLNANDVRLYLAEVADGATTATDLATAPDGTTLSNFVNGETALLTNIVSTKGVTNHKYVLRAWIDENYQLPTTNETSGNTQSTTSQIEKVSFTLEVRANG